MVEITKNMYVRFKYPRYYVPIQISKIKSKEYDEFEKYYSYITDNDLVITEEQIIGEPSFNIMDVVQVGDYINGKLVIDKWEEPFGAFAGETFIKLDGEDSVPTIRTIKSIVTKESMESVTYYVK